MNKNRLKYLFICWLAISFVVSSLFGIGAEAASTNGDKIANDYVKTLKSKSKYGDWDRGDVFSAKVTGKSTPEVIAIFYKINPEYYMYNNKINIYTYNTKSKKWSVTKTMYENEQGSPLFFFSKGRLVDNVKDQFVLGTVEGSGCFLTPKVYGSVDGKTIKKLLNAKDEDAFFMGNAIIKNKELFFANSSSIVMQKWKWQKNKFISIKGTGTEDRKLAQGAKYFLYLENKKGEVVLSGNRSIKMKVGEKISIVRKNTKDSSEYGYRLFVDGNNLDYSKEYTAVATKPGKSTWTLEPEAYGDSVKISINVTK
ncbi:hypothetical protein [Priestia megaterium]|uniref:hypothetical protein n=1 Tax=Priestia megaterium TaxID=1404 RepID=UPI003241D88F